MKFRKRMENFRLKTMKNWPNYKKCIILFLNYHWYAANIAIFLQKEKYFFLIQLIYHKKLNFCFYIIKIKLKINLTFKLINNKYYSTIHLITKRLQIYEIGWIRWNRPEFSFKSS